MRYFMILLVAMACSLSSMVGFAADLTFSPASPVVEVDKEITLSVAGTMEPVRWSAQKGQIVGVGTTVTYKAPDQVGFDVVTVSGAAGNVGMKIQIIAQSDFSAKNAVWEIFTSPSFISALL